MRNGIDASRPSRRLSVVGIASGWWRASWAIQASHVLGKWGSACVLRTPGGAFGGVVICSRSGFRPVGLLRVDGPTAGML